MNKFQEKVRRIAVAALAVASVVVMSGCATNFSPEKRLERWSVGENKDLVLVRNVRPLNSAEFDPMCKDGKLAPVTRGVFDEQGQALAYVQREICPTLKQWRAISGFTKSDFGKGAILAAGLIPPGMRVEPDDIVETSSILGADGRVMRPRLVARVVRKNVLKERDPTCYWDGQSSGLDAFATGGVVCPAEGWDWRDQKWAKK